MSRLNFQNRISHFLLSGIIILNLNVLFYQNCYSNDKKIIAERFYEQGLQFYKEGKLDSAVTRFEQALRYNKKLARAHNQLGLIYTDQGTIHSRFLANIEFEKAIKLDWNNPEFRFNRAMLHLKMDMTGSAVYDLKKVIKYDPDNYKAYYHLGLIKEKKAMRYRDMINPHPEAIIYFRDFAEDDKVQAVYYFNKVVALNPQFTEVYYRLGLLYYEFNELHEMIKLLEKAVKINAEDKNCHLFLGFAYHQDEQYRLAEQEFSLAQALMSPEEVKVFNSVEHIISVDQQKELEQESYDKEKFINSFWQKKDPIYLTEYNERKLEHYSRIAYANLRYSIPEKNIEGWQTDPGKVMIRFGKPNTLYRTRPEMDDVKAGENSMPLICSKEYWLYPDFQFVFEDRFLMNRYEFAWGTTPEDDYRNVFERMIEEKPDYYQLESKAEILEIAADDLVQFKGDRKTAIDFNYAIPADSVFLILRGDEWQANMKKGIFLFNNEWKNVFNEKKDVKFPENLIIHYDDANYFMDNSEIEFDPGVYHFVLELHDKESDRRGTLRKEVDIRSFTSSQLQLSDIFLALNIEADSITFNVPRSKLNISSNPFKKYYSNSPIYVYYEIYNLTKNASGLTNFKIEYTISSNKEKVGALKRFLERINLLKFSGDVTTTYEFEGNSLTEYQFQRFDINRKQEEYITLTIKVTDLNNDNETSQGVEFKVKEVK